MAATTPIKISLKTITPQVAANYLTKNTGNRPVRKRKVNDLSNEMLAGEWRVNGDTIRMNCTQLVDGQHRLMAVVQSGVTIDSFVADNVPFEVFPTIDRVTPRSGADTLHVSGEVSVAMLASALGVVHRYLTGKLNDRTAISNSKMRELMDEHPDIRESVKLANETKKLLPNSIFAGLHYLFSRKDQDQADHFMKTLVSGANLENGDPIYCLRERMLKNTISRTKLSRYDQTVLVIKAWNAYRLGHKIYALRVVDGEESPVIQ
jgi:hypothetical protein